MNNGHAQGGIYHRFLAMASSGRDGSKTSDLGRMSVSVMRHFPSTRGSSRLTTCRPVYADVRSCGLSGNVPLGQSITGFGRVGMWRGGCRSNISVAAPFVWRCLTGSAMAPFPHPAHRTGHADLPHPALGQNFTPSPTTRRAQAGLGVRARSARRDARVDRSRPCVA